MSNRDAEQNRQRQQKQMAEQKQKEAEARPDVAHRALVFLLKEQAKNNRDTRNETQYYIGELDKKMANPEKLAEVEAPPAPIESAEEIPPATQQPNTADALRNAPPRASRRFKRT